MPKFGRKKPISGKIKKEIMRQKKERRRNAELDEYGMRVHTWNKPPSQNSSELMNKQPDVKPGSHDPNRYRLKFHKLTPEEIEEAKKEAQVRTTLKPETALEVDVDDIYLPGSVLDMPKRPPWSRNMSKSKLLQKEEKYFAEYCEKIMESHSDRKLSFYELNLETWRQLWRCLEMSDIILLVTDIRNPALHFSPTLYDHVVNERHKHFILILNKIDLAPPALVTAWKHYFKEKFPELHVVTFTSIPKSEEELTALAAAPDRVFHKKRKRRRRTPAVGPRELWEVCERIVNKKVDLQDWREKIHVDIIASAKSDHSDSDSSDSEDDDDDSLEDTSKPSDPAAFDDHVPYSNGILTIGCCGYPNVGKSSIVNGLMGKKVVSVSKTPGHTKHFQTIFLTKNVRLCDSPGLVFPSLVSRAMQVLMGLFPVSQCREPFRAIKFLIEHTPLVQELKIVHPYPEDFRSPKDIQWSAYDVCEAWAVKVGFLTPKVGRPDVHRAANFLLRMVVAGRITLNMKPPGYFESKELWQSSEETKSLADIQLKNTMTKSLSSECLTKEIIEMRKEEERQLAEEAANAEDTDDDEDDSDLSEEDIQITSSNAFALLGEED